MGRLCVITRKRVGSISRDEKKSKGKGHLAFSTNIAGGGGLSSGLEHNARHVLIPSPSNEMESDIVYARVPVFTILYRGRCEVPSGVLCNMWRFRVREKWTENSSGFIASNGEVSFKVVEIKCIEVCFEKIYIVFMLC